MDDKYLIVIPYLAKEAQGSELELAVFGWQRHFIAPHQIVIVGEWHPIVDEGHDIIFIPCPRIEPKEGQYLPHLDIVHKFREARKAFPKSTGFIYACDDMYAVKDFSILSVMSLKKPADYIIPEFDWKKEKGTWMGDLGKTRELCCNEIRTTFWQNWVCHLPVYFGWKKILRIMDKYDCDNESYILENLYFNDLNEIVKRQRIIAGVDPAARYQYAVRTSNPGINSADDTKAIWITNANCGWSEKLESILRKHYNL